MSNTGFFIKYEVKDIPKKGKGIITLEGIPTGTCIWSPLLENQRTVNKKVVEVLDEKELSNRLETMWLGDAKFLLNHIYAYEGRMFNVLGDAKFWNHSKNPNTGSLKDLAKKGIIPLSRSLDRDACFALRNIHAGEELLDNYGTYDNPDYYVQLCSKYDVESAEIVAEKYD